MTVSLLNNSVDAILHLHEGKLDLYTGGYDDFERRRAEKIAAASATRAKQEAERAHLQNFIDRFRAKASKAAQAQSRIKRLAKMEPIAAAVEERVAPFTMPSPARPLAPPLIQLESAAVGYNGTPVLRQLNLRLDVDDRDRAPRRQRRRQVDIRQDDRRRAAAAVGRDEKGQPASKSAGFISIRSKRSIRTIRRWRSSAARCPTTARCARRSRLAQFGLSFDKQETTVANLSGGERARLLLNLVAMTAPHLLILDEPTNHLDIESRRALLDALNDYDGAVILITHDRSLIELVTDRLWLAADGHIKPFKGDMDEYARFVLDRAKARVRPAQDAGPHAAPPQPQIKKKKKKKRI